MERPVSDPVQELLDIEDIKRLKARYFRCLDQQDWDGLRDVFTDDVHFVAIRDLRGGDEVVDSLRSSLTGCRSIHHGYMPEIDLLGPEKAQGTWAMSDFVEFNEVEGRRRYLSGHGHYIEHYRKERGHWKIADLRLVRLRVDRYETESGHSVMG